MPAKVVHCKIEPFDVYVGRGQGSIWGNSFSHKEGTKAQFVVASVEEAIAAYESWIREQPRMMGRLYQLRDKTLGCWCKTKSNPDAPCHGDVLARLAAESYIPFAGDWSCYRHPSRVSAASIAASALTT